MLLKNKIALVTGGTRGIGRAIVEKFLENGATLIITGSRQETVEPCVAELKQKFPNSQVTGFWPILNDLESVQKMMSEIIATYKRLDIIVNNAGVSADQAFASYTQEMFDEVMALNVTGTFNICRAAYDYIKDQDSTVIINLSSMVSRDAATAGVAYPTSKFAVDGLTLSLARELAPLGIRVNAVAPGITNTDMVKALPDQVIQPLIETIPLRRIGEPEDIANACLFLASDMASYVTGQVLRVDGLARC
ncbi:3-oxoacyl-ACP reductase family protein [Actinotignum urinale]|uniref:SDR family NAD(P)-dependent oxidoreductase n=1 Tax=Actinotignum urinale TaxID=190146 RepID=UPI002A827B4E|nr:3-oxoacyl-ACP reductase family protein [Actinotignum urinale]MDY5129744.1 3-oxoacyl-ACP reductase family protein [Actinotignum urinale]